MNKSKKNKDMGKPIIVGKKEMPEFLPHGWKTKVAEALGVHPNTVNNNLKKRKGETEPAIFIRTN